MKQQEEKAVAGFSPPAKILAIDDSPSNLKFIAGIFPPPGYEVLCVQSAKQGIETAAENPPELILMDIMMPEIDGFELCQRLKSRSCTADIPVIFVSAKDSINDKLRGFDLGAIDFITKPFNHLELIARVNTQIKLSRMAADREKMTKFALEEKRQACIARIAAGISHNFSNLLGASLGNLMFVEHVLRKENAPQDAFDSLDDLKESLKRQKIIVQQFLHLADHGSISLEKGLAKPQAVDLQSLLHDVIDNLLAQPESEKGTPLPRFQINIPANNSIFCDEDHAQQIFHLILSEMRASAATPATIRIEMNSNNKKTLSCRICCGGMKLDPRIGEGIFEPFSLPLANVGTGLAFSVSRQLVQKNNGTINARTDDSGELCIKLTFPAPPDIP